MNNYEQEEKLYSGFEAVNYISNFLQTVKCFWNSNGAQESEQFKLF